MLKGRNYSKLETIDYAPGLQDSGDLEAATKTISATSEPGSADYTVAALGIAAPDDTRLSVLSTGVLLTATIDSFGGGGAVLNYRIKKDGVSIGTGTVSTGASTGTKYVSHSVTTGVLTGNAAYTLFFWTDAGTCVLSLVKVQMALGSADNGGYPEVLRLTYSGEVQLGWDVVSTPSGSNMNFWFFSGTVAQFRRARYGATITVASSNNTGDIPAIIVPTDLRITLDMNIANKLAYVNGINFALKSVL